MDWRDRLESLHDDVAEWSKGRLWYARVPVTSAP